MSATPKQIALIRDLASRLGVLDRLIEELDAKGYSLEKLPWWMASRYITAYRWRLGLDASPGDYMRRALHTTESIVGGPLRPGTTLDDAEDALDGEPY